MWIVTWMVYAIVFMKRKLKKDAHLHGILNTIRDLNLTLVSVNPAEN